jgi:hypothetical protein
MGDFYLIIQLFFSSLIVSVLQHRKVERIDKNAELERIWKESLGLFHGTISAFVRRCLNHKIPRPEGPISGRTFAGGISNYSAEGECFLPCPSAQ